MQQVGGSEKLFRILGCRGWSHVIALVLIAVAVAVVYGRATTFALLEWDDTTYVTGNPRVQQLGRAWTDTSKGWAPVAETGWALIYRFEGDTAALYHVLNVIFHYLNGVLVYLLALFFFDPRRAGASPRPVWAALLTSGFFALHPIQVETVCWVTAFRDLSATFFSLGALLAYLSFADRDCRTGEAGKWRWYTVALVCFCLATLSKVTAVTAIGVAWLLDRALFRRSHRHSLLHLVPWLCVAAPALVLNFTGQSRLYLHFRPSLWTRPFIVMDAIGFYLRKIVFPFPILPAYGRSARWLLESGVWRWGWIPAVAALVGLFLLRRRSRLPWWGLWVMIVSILPVSGLLVFAAQNNSTVYDHYLYLGLLGPALVFGGLCSGIRRRWLSSIPIAAVLGLGLLAFGQVGFWRNDETLWENTLSRAP
ncbi:MAG: hypothetical protein HQ559_00055, partial [Lentisphaerae bacterium]|nr:hypothetical protein [Lentisphaerota bacterium]